MYCHFTIRCRQRKLVSEPESAKVYSAFFEQKPAYAILRSDWSS
eukprot:COSAG05_NODE_13742_length_419_cov_1.106250_1_plen_43_part_10